MHSNGKGIARSALPYSRSKPSWVKEDAETVKAEIAQLAKKGKTPSQIGVILRDSKGYPQIKAITGQKILRILKKSGLAPEIPEDLYHLIKLLLMSEDIWTAIERTRTPSSDSFLSSPESTDLLDTTRPRSNFPPLGNMTQLLPMPW